MTLSAAAFFSSSSIWRCLRVSSDIMALSRLFCCCSKTSLLFSSSFSMSEILFSDCCFSSSAIELNNSDVASIKSLAICFLFSAACLSDSTLLLFASIVASKTAFSFAICSSAICLDISARLSADRFDISSCFLRSSIVFSFASYCASS